MVDNTRALEFEINPVRLKYLLDLYRLSKADFLNLLNRDKKRKQLSSEIVDLLLKGGKVKVPILNRIDQVFNEGVTWYISQRPLPDRKKSSIFFRKESFNSGLNLESRKLINDYEELKFEIQTLCNYINFDSKKELADYKLSDDPKKAAKDLREKFDAAEKKLIERKIITKAANDKDRDYLRNLIRCMEEFKIFVFEFTEAPRKKEKTVFNGFFMAPNIIVIKRQQKYFRREIFTLVHELAHYLLNFEEVDENIEENVEGFSKVELWCNTFTYYFLLGFQGDDFEKLEKASAENQFHREQIQRIHDKTRLSHSALYTRLWLEKKLSRGDYTRILSDIKESIRKKELEEKLAGEEKKRMLEEQGKEVIGFLPKPIESNLFKELVKINYFEGNINENRLREYLKIKPDKPLEEAIY